MIGFLIYSLFSKNDSSSYVTSSRPIYNSNEIYSNESKIFKNIPEFESPSTQHSSLSQDKKSFLTTLMTKTNEKTSDFVNPLYNRDLSQTVKKGGYRCMNLRRF
jgi:hypothetical protein